MAIVLSGTTNDILVNGVSVATDAEVSSAVASGVATKANTADLKEIGVGQTWQDVTASRVAGTTYTNTTGKPISVAVTFGTSGTSDANFVINGTVVWRQVSVSASLSSSNARFVIPNGVTYGASNSAGGIFLWMELR